MNTKEFDLFFNGCFIARATEGVLKAVLKEYIDLLKIEPLMCIEIKLVKES